MRCESSDTHASWSFDIWDLQSEERNLLTLQKYISNNEKNTSKYTHFEFFRMYNVLFSLLSLWQMCFLIMRLCILIFLSPTVLGKAVESAIISVLKGWKALVKTDIKLSRVRKLDVKVLIWSQTIRDYFFFIGIYANYIFRNNNINSFIWCCSCVADFDLIFI